MHEFKLVFSRLTNHLCEEIEKSQLEGWETKGDLVVNGGCWSQMMTRDTNKIYETHVFDTYEEMSSYNHEKIKSSCKGTGRPEYHNGKFYLIWMTKRLL